LRQIPEDKIVVLGLISTKTSEIESLDVLMKRVDEAARYFPRERFAVSTQCGFASVFDGNPIDAQVQKAKLKLVAELARSV
jgi:5-methyltetrahydropteroyltriglutamate--homocysteine methyltransferase